MLFNSLTYALFLPIVFCLYWFATHNKVRLQNALLLIASYVFYGWWDWQFLSLIVISSLTDFMVGLYLGKSSKKSRRRFLLGISLFVNLGLLGFCKYSGFFIDNMVVLLRTIGFNASRPTLQFILPIGISFYTFQTLSYTIDVFRRRIEPTRDILAFFSFVAFFPQLVAGPIERAADLLPQFIKQRKFSYEDGRDGMRLILWGLFKKVVIADTLAIYADRAFESHASLSAGHLWVGILCFAFQIYTDFSGYSDIAVGSSRLFGFRLMTNFKTPYFAMSIPAFWRRWHISLSTWFRDYIYIPLGGTRSGPLRHAINIMITFTISGFWHGAAWTFIAWGTFNGALYLVWQLVPEKSSSAFNKFTRISRSALGLLLTFGSILMGWILFRAQSVLSAWEYFKGLFSFGSTSLPLSLGPVFLILLLALWELVMHRREHPLQLDRLPVIMRWIIYLILAIAVTALLDRNQPFIYFQF